MIRRFNSILYVLFIIFISTSCEKEDEAPLEIASITVTSITVNRVPLKLDYYTDEVLDLSGLVITQIMTDGSSEEIPFSEFENKGIRTTPSNGAMLTQLLREVKVTHTATSKSTSFDLTIVAGISSAEDIYEPNNSFETATPITTCNTITATINSINDIDYYYFDTIAGETIKAQVLNIPSNFLVKRSLYDANQNLITSSIQVIADEELSQTLVINESAKFYMTIEVENNEYSSQPYTLYLDNGSCD